MDNPDDQSVTIDIPETPAQEVTPLVETPIESPVIATKVIETLSNGYSLEPKIEPQIERNEKGQITKGVAQDTNKNGTAGPKCEACEKGEEILKMIVDYYNNCAESLDKNKPVFPQRATLARKLGYTQYTITRWEQRTLEDETTLEHPEMCVALKKLDDLQEEYLNIRTLGRSPVGAIFQLKVNHGKVETEKKLLGNDPNEPLRIQFVDEKPIPGEQDE